MIIASVLRRLLYVHCSYRRNNEKLRNPHYSVLEYSIIVVFKPKEVESQPPAVLLRLIFQ